MSEYEAEVSRIVESVYDNGRAYALRDGDGIEEELDDLGVVRRMRLGCRSAENLLLTDEVLAYAGLSWEQLLDRTNAWIDQNSGHLRFEDMVAFRDGGFDRKNHDLKPLRMLLVGAVMASNKPWEVLVGQAIAQRVLGGCASPENDDSLDRYLGEKAVRHLIDGTP